MSFSAIWRWIDRDLDQVRPLSALLILLPFIPFGIALEVTKDAGTHDAFLLGGMVIAVPWFLYVIWRGLKVVVRSFRDTASYFGKLPLSPAQRGLRLVAGILAMIVVGGYLFYTRH